MAKAPARSTTSQATLTGAGFTFSESLDRDHTVHFTLTRFDASFSDTQAGSFSLRDIDVQLAAPAEARVEGETLRFPAGALSLAVEAKVAVNGEPLFDGAPQRTVTTNDLPATAIRAADGSFHFVDATFIVGDFTAVLNTAPAPLSAIH